jgi:hypothetical protein
MREVLFHTIGLMFSAAMTLLGRLIARQPNRMVRFFTLGMGSETRIALGFSRITGWFFLVMGCVGVILYLVMIPIDLLHSK